MPRSCLSQSIGCTETDMEPGRLHIKHQTNTHKDTPTSMSAMEVMSRLFHPDLTYCTSPMAQIWFSSTYAYHAACHSASQCDASVR